MPEKAKRSQWLKYLFGGLLAVLLFIVAFYQPILFAVAQLVGQQVAKSQQFSLRFEVHGSIFSNLYIDDLHIQPLPENRTLPLERVDAGRIGLRYNLFNLLKKDFLNVIELVELKDINIVVRQVAPSQQKGTASARIPAIIPKKIDIQNVNLTVQEENGDFQLRKFALALQQGEQGYLACASLRIPALGTWNQLRAGLRYNQGRLELTDFALEPIVAVNRLQVDLSGSEQGRFQLALAGRCLCSCGCPKNGGNETFTTFIRGRHRCWCPCCCGTNWIRWRALWAGRFLACCCLSMDSCAKSRSIVIRPTSPSPRRLRESSLQTLPRACEVSFLVPACIRCCRSF
jgi:hypothetical protein